jgi:DNA-binding Lrp family transcriptional regulator
VPDDAYRGELDGLDRRIIDHLTEDGRATYGAIGATVGLSAPAVKRRMDRLVDDGIIRRFTVEVDHVQLGISLEAFTELSFSGDTRVDAIASVADGIPEVQRVFTMAGDPDALAWLRVRDVADLQRVVDLLRAGDHVTGTKTMIVLQSSTGERA